MRATVPLTHPDRRALRRRLVLTAGGGLLALILCTGSIYWVSSPGRTAARSQPPPTKRPSAAATAASAASPVIPASVAASAPRKAPAAGEPADDLSRAAVAEIETHLRVLVSRAGQLRLKEGEFAALVNEVVHLQRINGELKSQVAQVRRGPTGDFQVFVPSRPDVAEELWRLFNQDLAAALSPKRADEIDDFLGEDLMVFFSGYGAADETYTFTPSPTDAREFDFQFSAVIPRDLPRETVSVIGSRFGGQENGSNPVTLDQILKRPEYAFLSKIVQKM